MIGRPSALNGTGVGTLVREGSPMLKGNHDRRRGRYRSHQRRHRGDPPPGPRLPQLHQLSDPDPACRRRLTPLQAPAPTEPPTMLNWEEPPTGPRGRAGRRAPGRPLHDAAADEIAGPAGDLTRQEPRTTVPGTRSGGVCSTWPSATPNGSTRPARSPPSAVEATTTRPWPRLSTRCSRPNSSATSTLRQRPNRSPPGSPTGTAVTASQARQRCRRHARANRCGSGRVPELLKWPQPGLG